MDSDLASIRVGMMSGVTTLRFMYTFDESLPRREGVGMMSRQFSGAATFEFRREGEAWVVSGHFFDDVGRSGQVCLVQQLAGVTNTNAAPPFVIVKTKVKLTERGVEPDPTPDAVPGR